MSQREHEDIPVAADLLERDLGAVFGGGEAIPRSLDDRVLGAAERRFAHRRRVVAARRVIVGGASVAAAVALVAVVLMRPPARTVAAVDPWDVDGSGVVDIADALALALAVEAGGSGVDLDGDGVVALADAEAIAARVVSLDRFALPGNGMEIR